MRIHCSESPSVADHFSGPAILGAGTKEQTVLLPRDMQGSPSSVNPIFSPSGNTVDRSNHLQEAASQVSRQETPRRAGEHMEREEVFAAVATELRKADFRRGPHCLTMQACLVVLNPA